MDFSVVFSPTSIRDLAESVAYIARHDPEAAGRVGDSIIDAAERLLSRQPHMGPKCPEYTDGLIRYWLHRDYRIVYQVNEEDCCVEVLRIWKCSRGDWPLELSVTSGEE